MWSLLLLLAHSLTQIMPETALASSTSVAHGPKHLHSCVVVSKLKKGALVLWDSWHAE
jgi:hypothetical protein